MPNPILVALDTTSTAEAVGLCKTLEGLVGGVKLGLEFFTANGPDGVRAVAETGQPLFLDLKFHDIPRTVAKAGVEAARLGVKMFDVHASGSAGMMRATVIEVNRACRREALRKPKILAVTVLTSLGDEDLKAIGYAVTAAELVERRVRQAVEAGCDGVISSPREAALARRIGGPGFLVVTPGVRPAGASMDDQARAAAPAEALKAGASHLVVGRPIIAAPDPRAAAEAIAREMAGA